MTTPIIKPRKRIVGISLKMYFSPGQTQGYISKLVAKFPSLPPNIILFIIPDFLSISTAGLSILYPAFRKKLPILLGAQDCFYEDSGAYTGEISPKHLKEVNCSIVELGHAERRRLFGETDEIVAKKVDAVLRNGMIPLVCVGEKNGGSVEDAVEEVRGQVVSVLEVLGRYGKGEKKGEGESEVIFAYEPVWAIGQASAAEPGYVVDVTREIRKICEEKGEGERVSIIYGGSAGKGTFAGISKGVDGLFLGRFGHDIQAVMSIVDEIALT